MARQKGILKVVGTLGAINFYDSQGVGYSRMAGGGFNGKAIRTKPSMQRVRENASEFGHCSRAKKHFRLSLMPFLAGIKGKALHSRMMTLFTSIKALDGISERGKRRVHLGLQTAKGRRMLTNFTFTPENTLLESLQDHARFEWETQTLSVRNFTTKGFKVPKVATHLGVSLGILDFDFGHLDAALEVSPTRFLEVHGSPLDFTLMPDVVVAPQHTGVAVLGLRFYEIIEGEVYEVDGMIGALILGR